MLTTTQKKEMATKLAEWLLTSESFQGAFPDIASEVGVDLSECSQEEIENDESEVMAALGRVLIAEHEGVGAIDYLALGRKQTLDVLNDEIKRKDQVLRTLVASLKWEFDRSGTTYNGYEEAVAEIEGANAGKDPEPEGVRDSLVELSEWMRSNAGPRDGVQEMLERAHKALNGHPAPIGGEVHRWKTQAEAYRIALVEIANYVNFQSKSWRQIAQSAIDDAPEKNR